MNNYFYNMVDPDEMATLEYIPTIPKFLEFIKKQYSDYPAISDKVTTYTYEELVSRVAKRVTFINSLGLEKGSNIAVLAKNDLDAMELFLAIPAAGHVLIMLPNALNDKALAGISMKFDLAGMFVGKEFTEVTANLPCKTWSSTSIGETESTFADVEKDTTAAIFFTGGTTGAPKGAVHSHGSIMRGSFNGVFGPGSILHKRYIAMLPLSHIFGAIMGYMAKLYTGSLTYTCTDMRAGIGDIPVVRPTTLVLVPGLVEIILNIAKLKGRAFLGDLELIMCGAAPVPPRQMEECRELGITLCAGYGLTECANLTSGNCDTDKKPESMGHIYPEQQVKVVDGELWIKGDNVMKEYYKDPEHTAEVLEDGWFKTGDLVEFDDNDWIYITGRIKNLIILPNGENVSPEELENGLLENRMVKEIVVSEEKDVIKAEVFPDYDYLDKKKVKNVQEEIQNIVDKYNRELPSYKRINKVYIRKDEFEKTTSQKIKRQYVKK